MDLPLRTEARSRGGEAGEGGEAESGSGVFFTGAADQASCQHLATGRPIPKPKRRSAAIGRKAALALAAAGCIVLAVYGLATRHPTSGGPGLTVHVPSASQSVAVIKALPPPNLLKPVSPQEAAKENAERPFVARPDTPARRFVLHADADDRTRAVTCLAQAVYYEAAGEGADGGRAVAQVVLNRLRHPGFPSTVCGVVYDGSDRSTGCQFSFTCDGSMQRVPVPWLWTRSKQIAEQALAGKVFAPVGHATHYHANYVLPYWADSLDKSVQIGRHIFYRLPRSLGDARAFSQHYGGTEPPFREPGATMVIPQTAVGQQVANALISDTPATSQKAPDGASHKPVTPLLIDSTSSTLLVDVSVPAQQQHRLKPKADCAAAGDRKQLAPLGATDMSAEAGSPSC